MRVKTTERFSGRAEAYGRYRERYDADVLLPRLREWCGLRPEWTVLDIGAGTGMLGEVFVENGNRVISAEPNAEMRAVCARTFADKPRVRVVDATAEETGLPDASVDMVAVGRALHWFDFDRAMKEFRRVLRPGGWFVVVAYGRSESGSAQNEELDTLLQEFSGEGKRTRENYAVYERLRAEFAKDVFQHEALSGEMRLNWQQARGLVQSLSYAPVKSDPCFAEFEARLCEWFTRNEHEGVLRLMTRYWLNVGRWD